MTSSVNAGAVAGVLALSIAGCGAAAEESFENGSDGTDEVLQGGSSGGVAQKNYLALGDSIAFGYSPLVTTPANPGAYKGYPEVMGGVGGNTVSNASCPGETSGSLLSSSPLDAPDNGCRNWKAAYSLHANYETTQIEFAESYIRGHLDTNFVTIDIGANDLLLLQKRCLGDPVCINAALPGVLGSYGQNLATTYTRVRQAGFTGRFVALTLYATNYNDALSVGAISALNQVMTQVTEAFGGVMADGFGAFNRIAAKSGGDACAARLLIKKPDGTCDIHPSPTGRDALAAAVLVAAAR
jgi:lysophospholipase L1-like esterase